MFERFLKFKRKCTHPNFPADKEYGYCPDCGEFIENRWYMTRCACCGIKLKAELRHGEVVPKQKFCHNCGSQEFTLEQLPHINFIDIHFAVVIKTVAKNFKKGFTQSWVEPRTSDDIPKLLQQFL